MYAEVAKLVAEDNVILAAVDCEQGSDTDFARSLPYNVTAYPTILYYQRGKLQFPYNHGHKKDRGSHRSLSTIHRPIFPQVGVWPRLSGSYLIWQLVCECP